MPMPYPETWVLVADAAHARLYRTRPGEQRLERLSVEESEAARQKSGDIMADRPGRAMDSSGVGQRSAMEQESDPQRVEQRRFAQAVADRLEAAANAGEFERLVVVAAPRALGDLRDLLPGSVRSRIDREIDKNYGSLDDRALEARLGPELWP